MRSKEFRAKMDSDVYGARVKRITMKADEVLRQHSGVEVYNRKVVPVGTRVVSCSTDGELIHVIIEHGSFNVFHGTSHGNVPKFN